MFLNKIAIFIIYIYKRLLSPFLGRSCRFYPTCSEYSLWHFENNSFLRATILSISRIFRCNPIFRGGIEYPIVKRDFWNKRERKLEPKKRVIDINCIVYWLIPVKEHKDRFLVIKRFKK